MAINRQRQTVSYGLSQPLVGAPPEPIISTRTPATTDKAEIGTTWINKSANTAFVLASIVANSATWTPTTVNAGATVTTGNLTVVAGNIIATAGDITATAGDITATAGDIIATAGDVTVTAGNIEVALGDITATAGDITAGGDIFATNDVNCRSVFLTGDEGTGFAGQVTLTNVVDETVSTGAGVVLMKTANPGDSSGWLKIYSGTDVRYVPYWTTLSP